MIITFDDGFQGEKTAIIRYGNTTFGYDTLDNSIKSQITPVPGQSIIIVRAVDRDSGAEAESSINVTVYDRGMKTMVGTAIFLFFVAFLIIIYFPRVWKNRS